MSNWMVYGANGCMGTKIVEEALIRGESPILAGRSGHVVTWAREKRLPCRIFDLHTVQEILPFLQDIQVFVDCAGPYAVKSSAILIACARKKVHYIDLTLEYSWSQRVFSFSSLYEEAGCWAVTGVSSYALLAEYLAGYLKGKLPNATSLVLTYTGSSFSLTKGCLLSYLSILSCGQKTRSNNQISTQWFSSSYKGEEWGPPTRPTMGSVARRVPLIDLITVWVVTRIPFISTFVSFPPRDIRMVRIMCMLARFSFLHKILQHFLRVYVQSRSPAASSGKIRLAGRAENAIGQHRNMQIEMEGEAALTIKVACDLAMQRFEGHKGVVTVGQSLGAAYLFAASDLETRMHHITYGEE